MVKVQKANGNICIRSDYVRTTASDLSTPPLGSGSQVGGKRARKTRSIPNSIVRAVVKSENNGKGGFIFVFETRHTHHRCFVGVNNNPNDASPFRNDRITVIVNRAISSNYTVNRRLGIVSVPNRLISL